MTLHVAGLWRYPVKSLAGEPLPIATLTPEGIPGDRIVHVRGPEGVLERTDANTETGSDILSVPERWRCSRHRRSSPTWRSSIP